MAEILHASRIEEDQNKIVIGNRILDIITSGMYNEPKMVVREYIQNSCDAIDDAVDKKILPLREGRIQVFISGPDRSITIEDNGIGVSNSSVRQTLCSIAYSLKNSQISRGFRGIGRLAGLGYCNILRFETRAAGDKKVAQVSWDGNILGAIVAEGNASISIEEAIRIATRIELLPSLPDHPSHFFKVTLEGVKRFHKDELMNVREIRNYISQTAPVEFREDRFSYSKLIESHLKSIRGYKSYKIEINSQAIFKPHEAIIQLKDGRTDKIDEIKFVEFKGKSGSVIAVGWYALTSFIASLPKNVLMRGIRVRQGNIAVSDEHFLDSIFTEQRFAFWHIGEVHVDYSLKLNARRDAFEPSSDVEPFLEQITILGKKLSRVCRSTSVKRNKRLSTLSKLSRMSQELSTPVFVDLAHKQNRIIDVLGQLQTIINEPELGADKEIARRIESIRDKLSRIENKDGYSITDYLDGRKYRNLSKKEIVGVMLKNVVQSYNTAKSVEDLVLCSIKQFLRKTSINRPC